jgi:DNA-binding XRE family transcriptional regulator
MAGREERKMNRIVLTPAEYATLVDDVGDAALADEAKRGTVGAPALPAELLSAVLNGSLHPLAAWREAAGLTVEALAEKSRVTTEMIVRIEAGRADPRLSAMMALAASLNLEIGDIVP